MKYEVKKTTDYDDWLATQSEKSKVQIAKRLSKIEQYGHFGVIKDVEDGVLGVKVEKWTSGLLRLYTGSKNLTFARRK